MTLEERREALEARIRGCASELARIAEYTKLLDQRTKDAIEKALRLERILEEMELGGATDSQFYALVDRVEELEGKGRERFPIRDQEAWCRLIEEKVGELERRMDGVEAK